MSYEEELVYEAEKKFCSNCPKNRTECFFWFMKFNGGRNNTFEDMCRCLEVPLFFKEHNMTFINISN